MKIEPGITAYLVNCRIENLGHVVQVIKFHAEASERFGGPYWSIESSAPLLMDNGSYSSHAVVRQEYLRPISGPSIAKHVRLWDELPREVTA